jgi:hypothetical protein
VTLNAVYRYPWFVPYIPAMLGLPSPFPLNIATTMRHE